jgi:hypothetical protein
MSVKEQDLLDVVNRLNKTIGCHHMSQESYYINKAYGGYALYKGIKNSSGIIDVSNGHTTRSRLLDFLNGYERGVHA